MPGRGAEDLWGERIRLNREINSGDPVVIVPFSTSNCGYCMIDGYFTENNYIGNNEQFGGWSYHMSLFNPQLDIYAFQKHFGWHTPILTYPPSLHEYHQNGFPTLLAFKAGEQVLQDFYNYSKFDTLKSFLWDSTARFHPTGEMHMATRLIYENGSMEAVYVVPGGSIIDEEEKAFAEKYKAYSFSSFDTLSEDNKKKHLFIRSGSDLTELMELFKGHEIPLNMDEHSFGMGEYRFPTDTVAFYGCFPNPFNPEKYVVLIISGGYSKLFWPANYLDYIVFSGDRPAQGKRLLYGHFDKDDPAGWHFSGDRSFSDVPREAFCVKRCEAPEPKGLTSSATPDIETSYRPLEEGAIWSLGNGACRFPEIAAGLDGSCWVTWEEDGNILLGNVNSAGDVKTWYAEYNESNSYNPKLVVDGDEVWLFYLNNQDNYYRLYTKSFKGGRFSDEILLTPKDPFDVVTPDVVIGANGEMTIAWCEWLANQRFLKFRSMKNGISGNIHQVLVAPRIYTKDYTNAWWPSLVNYGDEVWGAWNQHYPATCGVCGGALADTAVTITQPSESEDDWEQGGYPDIFTDGEELFVVWESSGWDVLNNHGLQQIKIARFDSITGRWTPGRILTIDPITTLNQTPDGACDTQENKYIVWSGRNHISGKPWGIYLARELDGVWSDPVLISEKDETARHPKIIVDSSDNIWISWHSGIGNEMKVEIVRLPTQ